MAFKVATAGTSSYIRRATTLNYDSAYTVLFRFYTPSSGVDNSYGRLWGISGTTGSNGSSDLGQYYDSLKFSSNGTLRIESWDGTTGTNSSGTTLAAGWHSVAIIRTSLSSVRVRINGTTYSDTSTTLSSREAVAFECALSDAQGDHVVTDSKITNYKSWQSALTDGEVDAEFLTTTVTKSGLFSQSEMSGEASVAGNTSATGSGSTWTAGANATYGTNDPGVTYAAAGGIPKTTRLALMGVG